MTSLHKLYDKSNPAAIAMIFMVLCALLMGWMQFLTPYQLDDLGYGGLYKESILNDGPGISWAQNWEFMKWHYENTNGRLGDKFIEVFLTKVPRWLMALMCVAACFSLTYFGSKAAFGSIRRHPLRTIIATFILTLVMPWGDRIFIPNYLLNYGLGLGLAMPAIWMFLRSPEPRRHHRLFMCMCFFISFLAAWWHEAYALPMLAGMVLLLIVYRKENTRMQYLVLTATLLGIVLILTAPGFWVRVNTNKSDDTMHEILNNFVKGGNVALLFPFSLGLVLLVKRWRAKLRRADIKLSLLALTMLFGAIVIFWISLYFKRIFWYVMPAVLLSYTVILCRLFSGIKLWLKLLITGVGCLFTAAHFAVTIPYYTKIVREYNEIIREFQKSREGEIFHDYSGRGFGPWITLYRARLHTLTYDTRCLLSSFYVNSDAYMLNLSPVCLKDFHSSNFHKPKEVINYKGYYVANDSNLYRKLMIFTNCKMEDGRVLVVPTIVNHFHSTDGKLLYYLEPDERFTSSRPVVSLTYWDQ